ncbi:MAG: hypothetical protein Q9171_001949 [Xanthocarpia ochracea]
MSDVPLHDSDDHNPSTREGNTSIVTNGSDRVSQSPSRTGTDPVQIDISDKASSRSQSSFHHPKSVRAADHNRVRKRSKKKGKGAAVGQTVREGKRPERYHPYPNGHSSTSRRPKEQRCYFHEAGSPGASSSSYRPEPSKKSRWLSGHPEPDSVSSDDACWGSPSSDSSLERLLAEVDVKHQILDDIDAKQSSLDVETVGLSGTVSSIDRVESHSAGLEVAGSSRRRFSYEAESHSSFSKDPGTSLSPWIPQRSELSGAYPDSDGSKHSTLDVPEPRGRVSVPVQASQVESREISPWSKECPDWRYSKKVAAGAIIGVLKPQPGGHSSQDSDARANRSSDSMRVRNSSVSSVATHVTVSCTSRILQQLSEAQDTDISTCYDDVALNENTLAPFSDGEKRDLPHLEDRPHIVAFAVVNEDVPVHDTRDCHNIDATSHKTEQLADRPLGNSGSSSGLADVGPSRVVAHNTSATRDASYTTSPNNQEVTEPFPNFTEEELRSNMPVRDTDDNCHARQQGHGISLSSHSNSPGPRAIGKLIDSGFYNASGANSWDIPRSPEQPKQIPDSIQDELQYGSNSVALQSRSASQHSDQPFDSSARDGNGRREHDARHLRNSSNAVRDDREGVKERPLNPNLGRPKSKSEALTEALSIDPSLQAGVYCRQIHINPLTEALPIDPSLQAGVYCRQIHINPQTPEPTLPPEERWSCPPSSRDSDARRAKGKQREVDPPSPRTSDARRAKGKQLVVDTVEPAHQVATEDRMEYDRETMTSSPAANSDFGPMQQAVAVGPSIGLVDRLTAADLMAAQRAVRTNGSTRTDGRNGHASGGGRERSTGERGDSMDESRPRVRNGTNSSSGSADGGCGLSECLRKPLRGLRLRSESDPTQRLARLANGDADELTLVI